MTWNRLEFHARSRDLDPGLAADVADPLWLLARQWQFGEFQGEDAGSPVGVSLGATVARLSAYRGMAVEGGAPVIPFRQLPVAPLEAVVESESVVDGPAAMILSAEAGLELLRRMDGEGVDPRVRSELRDTYPLDPAGEADLEVLDADGQRSFLLLKRASFDANGLYHAAGDPPAIPADVDVPPAAQAAFLAALQSWHAWYGARFDEFGGRRWRSSRMEYVVEVAAQGPNAYLVAETPGYADGRLDWPDFDLRVTPRLPQPKEGGLLEPITFEAPYDVAHELLPQQARFRGMPVSRFWEFENRKVYLGDIDAGPTDLIRLLMVEFALIAGDDWFTIPLDVPIGSLSRIDHLVVSNTFGERISIQSATEVDGPDSPWRMFVMTGDPAVETGVGSPWLFLVPSLAGSLAGAPIEEVAFLRDEMANLAWAVERKVEGVTGRPQDRHERWLATRPPRPDPPAMTTYELATRVPTHWFPLVPVQAADQRSIRLRRGRLLRAAGEALEVPRGRILEPDQPLRMHEEEVPRAGMRVTRSWQLARWHDGSTWLWVGRQKSLGRPERASNLEHDRLAEPPRAR